MIYLDEDKVRELVKEAVDLARNRSTADNLSDAAVVQRVLREKFVDGYWRSSYFLDLTVPFNPYTEAQWT